MSLPTDASEQPQPQATEDQQRRIDEILAGAGARAFPPTAARRLSHAIEHVGRAYQELDRLRRADDKFTTRELQRFEKCLALTGNVQASLQRIEESMNNREGR